MIRPIKLDVVTPRNVFSPVHLGQYLYELSTALEASTKEEKTEYLLTGIRENLELVKKTPIADAAIQAAKQMDQGLLMNPLPYHNAAHARAVTLSAAQLLLIENAQNRGPKTTPHTREMLLFAAENHDDGHPGIPNNFPFELEQRSFDISKPFLDVSGVNQQDQNFIRGLFLSTDLFNKPKFIDDAPAIISPAWPAELAYLLEDPQFATASKLISDADILFSVGVTNEASILRGNWLNEETRGAIPPGLMGTPYFISHVLNNKFSSTAGSFFASNMRCIHHSGEAAQQTAALLKAPAI